MCAGDDDSAGAGSPQILDILDVIPNIGMRMALVCAIIISGDVASMILLFNWLDQTVTGFMLQSFVYEPIT